jgi:hypothetical protein
MAQRCRRSGRLAVSFLALGLVLVLVLGAAGGCRRAQDLPAGDVIADLSLPQLGGGRFDPASVRGKKVLLNFWSPG